MIIFVARWFCELCFHSTQAIERNNFLESKESGFQFAAKPLLFKTSFDGTMEKNLVP